MSATPRDPEVLLAHAQWVRALALQLCADAHAAEDAAQDTLAAALRHPPEDPERARGFLARTLRNALAMTRRAARRRSVREAQVALPPDAVDLDAGELVARAELHRQLVEAVLQLPPTWRELVLRHYFEGIEITALAARMRCSPDAVRAQLRRARERLRTGLEDGGGAPARAFALLVGTHRPLATTGASTIATATAAIGVMTMTKTVVLCGAAAIAAAVWLLWLAAPESVPVAAGPTTGALPGAAVAASPGTAAAATGDAAPERRESPAPVRPRVPFRLEGLRASVPWTASFAVRATGTSQGLRQEYHEDLAIGPDGTFTVLLPAWCSTADGFALRLTAVDPFHLRVDARFGPEVREVQQPIVLQVEPVAVVTGRVVDPRDRGVPAARVVAFLPHANREPGECPTRGSALTDAEGNYRLQVPVAANLLLLAVPMHEAPLSGRHLVMEGGGIAASDRMRDDLLPACLRVDTGWGKVTEAPLLRLPEPAFVTGSLTTSDGAPLAGVEVLWLQQTSELALYDLLLGNLMAWADGSAGRVAMVRTDAAGRFRLPATPGKPGVCYPRDERGRQEPFVAPVHVTPPAEVDFRLGGDVAVLRVLCGGLPVPGVAVTTDTIGDRLTPLDRLRATDERGEMRLLRSERLDQPVTLRRPGAEPTRFVLPATASPRLPFVVELPPLQTAPVRLEFEGAFRVRQVELLWERLDAEATPLRTDCSSSDGEGAFRNDVPPGRYRLTVSPSARAGPRDPFLIRTTQEVLVPLRGAELRLPITHGGRVHITMTRGDGDWLGGTALLVGKTGTHHFTVDRRNLADSENLPAGNYELSIQRGDRVVWSGPLELHSCEATDVRIRLE